MHHPIETMMRMIPKDCCTDLLELFLAWPAAPPKKSENEGPTADASQQAKEDPTAEVAAHRRKDEIEFDHLRGSLQ